MVVLVSLTVVLCQFVKNCISGNMVFLYLLKLGAKNSLNGVVDADGGTTFKHLFTAFQWKR